MAVTAPHELLPEHLWVAHLLHPVTGFLDVDTVHRTVRRVCRAWNRLGLAAAGPTTLAVLHLVVNSVDDAARAVRARDSPLWGGAPCVVVRVDVVGGPGTAAAPTGPPPPPPPPPPPCATVAPVLDLVSVRLHGAAAAWAPASTAAPLRSGGGGRFLSHCFGPVFKRAGRLEVRAGRAGGGGTHLLADLVRALPPAPGCYARTRVDLTLPTSVFRDPGGQLLRSVLGDWETRADVGVLQLDWDYTPPGVGDLPLPREVRRLAVRMGPASGADALVLAQAVARLGERCGAVELDWSACRLASNIWLLAHRFRQVPVVTVIPAAHTQPVELRFFARQLRGKRARADAPAAGAPGFKRLRIVAGAVPTLCEALVDRPARP